MKSKLMRKEDLIELLQKLPDGTLIGTNDQSYGVGGAKVEYSTLEKGYLVVGEEEFVSDDKSDVKGKTYTVVPLFVIR